MTICACTPDPLRMSLDCNDFTQWRLFEQVGWGGAIHDGTATRNQKSNSRKRVRPNPRLSAAHWFCFPWSYFYCSWSLHMSLNCSDYQHFDYSKQWGWGRYYS